MKNINKNNETNCWNDTGSFGSGTCEELDRYSECSNCPVYIKSGRNIFNKEFDINDQMELAPNTSDSTIKSDKLFTPVLIFRIESEWLALKPSVFEKAVDVKNVHFVPGRSNDIFRGIVNIDGELLLCISFGELTGIQKVNVNSGQKNVFNRMLVLNTNAGRIVFYVDEIIGVKNILNELIKPVPSTISNSVDTLTGNIIEVDNYRIALIDENKFEKAVERNLSW